MADPKVNVRITGTDELSAVAEKPQGALGRLAGLLSGPMVLGAAALAAAGAKVVGFLKDTLDQSLEAERGTKRLELAVSNAGGEFAKLRPSLEATVQSVKKVSTAADDDLRAALERTITTTGDLAGSQKNLQLIADLSAARQIDLATASDIVGKAMNGNVTALNKLGIAGKDSTTVIENARAAFGGFAEKEAGTLSGRLANLRNGWDDFKEGVGNAIVGSGLLQKGVGFLSGAMEGLGGFVERNETAIQAVVAGFGTFAGKVFDVARAIYETLAPAIGPVLVGAFKLVMQAVGLLGTGFQKLAGGALLAFGHIEQTIGKFVGAAGKLLERVFGITAVSTIADSLKEVGARAIEQSTKLLSESERGQRETLGRMVENEVKAQGTVTSVHRQSAADRLAIARQEASERKALIDTTVKALETSAGGLQLATVEVEGGWKAIGTAASQAASKIVLSESAQKQLAEATELVRKRQQGVLTEAERTRLELLETVAQTETLAHSYLDIARAAGLVNDETAGALGSVVNMGTALAKFGFGSPEGLISLISGLSNLIGGWGSSPAEQARKAAHQANTAALEKNSRELGNFNLGSSGKTFSATEAAVAAAQKAAAAVPISPLGLPATQVSRARAGKKAFLESLLKSGVSAADAQELLKAIGISGFDSADAKTFLGALGSAGENLEEIEFGQFDPKSFEDQLKALTEGFGVLGTEDADDKLEGFRDLVKQFSPALAEALEGDLSTEEGRKSATQNLRSLFQKLKSGGLSATEIGVSSPQFLSLLQAIIPLLSSADGAGAGPAAAAVPASSSSSFAPLSLPPGIVGGPAFDPVSLFSSPNGVIDSLGGAGSVLDVRFPATAERNLSTLPEILDAIRALSLGRGDVTIEAINIDGAREPREVARELLDLIDQGIATRALSRSQITGAL